MTITATMSEAPNPKELVSSSLQSRQSLADVLAALRTVHNFSNLSTQLNALQTVLVCLPELTTLGNSEFDDVRGILAYTSKFCVDIKNELERVA
jgi:hypothetical protein